LSEKYHSLPYYLFRLFPINNNKIVFCNFAGKGFGDNPKYIAKEMIDQNMNYDMVWLINGTNDASIPNQIRVVNSNSLRAVFELVTAKVWIDNNRKSFAARKRKNQYYIQTWHGNVMIKKIEKDVEDKLPISYLMCAKNDSKMIDLCISNSKYCTDFYKSSFWYDGTIMECGCPRNDILLNHSQQEKDEILKALGLTGNINIALFAPTFRIAHIVDMYFMQYDQLLNELKGKFGGEWVILVRMHPSMADKSDIISYNDQVRNASSYDDMQELMIISDILITDYSSTMFEFSLLQRPVFLYALDVEDYIKNRGFYFNFYGLPFPIAKNMQELRENIKYFDYNTYINRVDTFMDNIGLVEDGTASQKIVNRINEITLLSNRGK
jgi:CDP-glycerol glycerophosphotransferase